MESRRERWRMENREGESRRQGGRVRVEEREGDGRRARWRVEERNGQSRREKGGE